jgi:hypothetical protein
VHIATVVVVTHPPGHLRRPPRTRQRPASMGRLRPAVVRHRQGPQHPIQRPHGPVQLTTVRCNSPRNECATACPLLPSTVNGAPSSTARSRSTSSARRHPSASSTTSPARSSRRDPSARGANVPRHRRRPAAQTTGGLGAVRLLRARLVRPALRP